MNNVTLMFPKAVGAVVRKAIVDKLTAEMKRVTGRDVSVEESGVESEPGVTALVTDMDGLHPVTALNMSNTIVEVVTTLAKEALSGLQNKVTVISKASTTMTV